ncbi:MAG: hypothetical protein HQL13_07715 [Candidatus Omnitrophica bacterium]|nr:hypothetical protein [Candidatus Omnitrophota bacterium]
MAPNNFINKIRSLDNRAAQWMSRHFYVILFEVILGVIFVAVFVIALKIIYLSFSIPKTNITDQLLLFGTINSMLIVVLLILIALGVLNIINNNSRLRNVLKNIEFNLSRRRTDKPQDN